MATENLAPETAQTEIAALKAQIEQANRDYYIRDAPVLSDDIYDGLMRRLIELETAFPELITPDSPTQKVGAPLESDFAKIAHREPMLSLKDVRGDEELGDWEKSVRRHVALKDDVVIEYVCEPKIDGLSAAIVYENGVLSKGITRGNGQIGEDVTGNIKTIRSVPHKLHLDPIPSLFEARGEIFMLRSEFEKYNAKLAEAGKPLLAIHAMRPAVQCARKTRK
jgi:DNA ligase (NAD+)